jgi:hypothetical protein
MRRPTFIIAEPEPGSALSTRKLVVETAKYNVLTAHSMQEAVEIFRTGGPIVDALIVAHDLEHSDILVKEVKRLKASLLVICISPNRNANLEGTDYHISGHEPQALVELCRELFGDPRSLDERQQTA